MFFQVTTDPMPTQLFGLVQTLLVMIGYNSVVSTYQRLRADEQITTDPMPTQLFGLVQTLLVMIGYNSVVSTYQRLRADEQITPVQDWPDESLVCA